MSAPAELEVVDALDRLVHQFAEPLAFFRELIQNALDAGSHEVEITLGFEASADAGDDPDPEGALCWRVDDWGEGMTREIIERRLTRLFSSAKADDRTKIGKFGIGFVSVFAIGPQAVVVDTAREGESWRLIFAADTSYELRRLGAPVDGTKIQVLKPMRRSEHDALAARAREVIAFWCRHCDGEIRVDGAPIRRPFDLDVALKVRARSELAEIVVGHPSDGSSFFGLYNRGLTLLEGAVDDAFSGLHVKVSSPLVEHTLTRDDVIRDRSFDRVIGLVKEAVRGPLCRRAFAAVAEALAADARVSAEAYRALAWHISRGELADEVLDLPIVRTISGRPCGLGELRRALASPTPPVVAGRRTALSDALEARGDLVLLASEDAPIAPLAAALGGIWRIGQVWCMPLRPAGGLEISRWEPLLAATRDLLRGRSARVRALVLGRFDYPESAIAGRAAIVQSAPYEISRRAQVDAFDGSLFARPQTLVVNADHPTVAALAEVSQREPEHAAYVLAKLFLIAGRRLDAAVDGDLLRDALELRCQRLTG